MLIDVSVLLDTIIIFYSYYLLYCVPEILVLGCGKRMGRVSKELRDFLHSNGIKIEAIDTVHDSKALSFFLMYQQPYSSNSFFFFAFHISLIYSEEDLCESGIRVKGTSTTSVVVDPLTATTMHFFVLQNKV